MDGSQDIYDFGEGVHARKHTSLWKGTDSHEEQIHQLMILELSKQKKMQESKLVKYFS